MAHRPRPAARSDESESEDRPKIEPVGTVKRELISPAGHKVLVDVPVYPPFQLEAYTRKKRSQERREKAASEQEDEEA